MEKPGGDRELDTVLSGRHVPSLEQILTLDKFCFSVVVT